MSVQTEPARPVNTQRWSGGRCLHRQGRIAGLPAATRQRSDASCRTVPTAGSHSGSQTVQQSRRLLPRLSSTRERDVGNVMQTLVATLPLNGRYLDRLIRISAGVTTDSASNPRVAGSSYWGGVTFNVDGAAFNDPGNGARLYAPERHGYAALGRCGRRIQDRLE